MESVDVSKISNASIYRNIESIDMVISTVLYIVSSVFCRPTSGTLLFFVLILNEGCDVQESDIQFLSRIELVCLSASYRTRLSLKLWGIWYIYIYTKWPLYLGAVVCNTTMLGEMCTGSPRSWGAVGWGPGFHTPWTNVSYYRREVKGKRRAASSTKLVNIHICHELPELKTATSIYVELMQLHLVDLDASIHLILQKRLLIAQ